jgi:predicted ATP-grasp superfamily ATP-dependent carboligase
LKPNTLAIPKAWRAEDRESLLARYDEASALVSPENLIVQEIVPGGGEAQFSYAALCRDGSSLASMVARRTRQYPMDFGQFSTYVETVEGQQVTEPAERLLAATRFTGLVEVEFKRDPRNGQFKVFDINPRVWGWHTLSRRAGIDFPHLLWLLCRDEPVPELRGRAGERWMHVTADLRVAVEEILKGRLSLRAYMRP